MLARDRVAQLQDPFTQMQAPSNVESTTATHEIDVITRHKNTLNDYLSGKVTDTTAVLTASQGIITTAEKVLKSPLAPPAGLPKLEFNESLDSIKAFHTSLPTELAPLAPITALLLSGSLEGRELSQQISAFLDSLAKSQLRLARNQAQQQALEDVLFEKTITDIEELAKKVTKYKEDFPRGNARIKDNSSRWSEIEIATVSIANSASKLATLLPLGDYRRGLITSASQTLETLANNKTVSTIPTYTSSLNTHLTAALAQVRKFVENFETNPLDDSNSTEGETQAEVASPSKAPAKTRRRPSATERARHRLTVYGTPEYRVS